LLEGPGGVYDGNFVSIIGQMKGLFLKTKSRLGQRLDEIIVHLRPEYAPRIADLAEEIARICTGTGMTGVDRMCSIINSFPNT
jgi:hypothetical protein